MNTHIYLFANGGANPNKHALQLLKMFCGEGNK